jgi:hypothetical protein
VAERISQALTSAECMWPAPGGAIRAFTLVGLQDRMAVRRCEAHHHSYDGHPVFSPAIAPEENRAPFVPQSSNGLSLRYSFIVLSLPPHNLRGAEGRRVYALTITGLMQSLSTPSQLSCTPGLPVRPNLAMHKPVGSI